MLSMGLTLTVDDFRQCLKNPVPVRGASLSLSSLFSRASFLRFTRIFSPPLFPPPPASEGTEVSPLLSPLRTR